MQGNGPSIFYDFSKEKTYKDHKKVMKIMQYLYRNRFKTKDQKD